MAVMNFEEEQIEKIIAKPQTRIEDALLGCIFLNNDEYVNVMNLVNENMFKYEANNKVYKIIKKLFEEKIVIDRFTVWQEIINNGWNSNFLNEEHVNGLAEGGGAFRSKNAVYYAKAMSLKFSEEKVPEMFYKLYLETKDNRVSIDEGMALANKYMLKLAENQSSKESYFKLELNEDSLFKDMEDKLAGKVCTGLETGIWEIDKCINGLEKGKVYNFTGAPGSGKTVFALQVALNTAKQGKHVLYGSFEMGVDELTLRLICMEMKLSNWAIDDPEAFINKLIEKKKVKNQMEGFEWIKKQIREGRRRIENLPIEIFRPENANITNLKTAIDKYLLQNKQLDLVVVDHTDLMHNHQNAHSDLYTIYKKLKDYAVNYGIPILALHQFNKAEIVNSDDYKPTVYALKGGQAIHDNADVIMLLYRPAIYRNLIEKKPELKDKCEVIYAKRRGGKLHNPSDLNFNGIMFSSCLDLDVA